MDFNNLITDIKKLYEKTINPSILSVTFDQIISEIDTRSEVGYKLHTLMTRIKDLVINKFSSQILSNDTFDQIIESVVFHITKQKEENKEKKKLSYYVDLNPGTSIYLGSSFG